jgi:PhzF family phenazine biosynthesis protein
VRIFSPGRELPFAGHPTLGSAHAWLEAGGVPRGDVVVQECGAGLVDVRRSPRLGFAAPPLRRSGPVDADLRARIVRALGITDAAVEDMAWIDNGPGWVGVDLGSADAVVGVVPDIAAFTDLKVTVLGRWDATSVAALGADVEVRAFYADGREFGEDPVTGSANAGLAQWLIGTGALPSSYTSRQGSVIGREGRVRLEAAGDRVWVSGDAVTRIVGEVDL